MFAPRRVAIVGASEGSSWARNLVNSLGLAGGTASIIAVNPKGGRAFGRTLLPSLSDVSEPVDLAFILVGPDKVEQVLEDAAGIGIKNAVVLAGGYGESGADGASRQRSLVEAATRLDITIIGPNTIGFVNARDGFAPWAVATHAKPLPGAVGAVFESGSMGRATFEFAQAHALGSTIWASVGNAAVVNTLDVVEYLLQDEPTRAIALFLETIREPKRFLALAHKALELGKPIVAFKAGRTEEGQRSAMAHTGAIATDDAVVNAAFRQSGVIRVESLEELASTVGFFGHNKRLPQGRRMGVVTSSGGGCNVIADLASHEGLALPPWSQTTLDHLAETMPPFSSMLNPLDTTGYGHSRKRARPTKAEDDLLEIAAKDAGVDFMYSMITPLPAERPDEQPDLDGKITVERRMEILGQIVADSPVPIYLSSNTCLDISDYPRQLLDDNGLQLLPGGNLALRSIAHAVNWVERRKALGGSTASFEAHPSFQEGPDGVWAEDEGRDLLASVGVDVVPAKLARSAAEAIAAAADFGAPVALKICSRDIAHKTDIGGVVLNVFGAVSAKAAYDKIMDAVRVSAPDATIRGVLVSPMRDPGIELMVGVTVDPTFGPVLAVGLGGIWVEVLRDTSLRVLPVDVNEIRQMLSELRGLPMLTGGRGTEAVDLDELSKVITAIGDAALALGDRLSTLEVNPLRISHGRIEALDVLTVTLPAKSGGTE
jgi:acyl-CoA synthetase (NDP forming)